MSKAHLGFPTLEEMREIDETIKKLAEGRMIVGFNEDVCDKVLFFGNGGRNIIYLYGVKNEELSKLFRELTEALEEQIEWELTNQNERYCNVILRIVYRKVFNGPLTKKWYANTLTAAGIAIRYGWFGRGYYASEHKPKYRKPYLKQLAATGFPDWDFTTKK